MWTLLLGPLDKHAVILQWSWLISRQQYHLTSVHALQSLGLLGDVLEPEPVARFLRHCPGLSKQTIGDLLGENDQFFLDVLDAFTATFKFRGELCSGEVAPHRLSAPFF